MINTPKAPARFRKCGAVLALAVTALTPMTAANAATPEAEPTSSNEIVVSAGCGGVPGDLNKDGILDWHEIQEYMKNPPVIEEPTAPLPNIGCPPVTPVTPTPDAPEPEIPSIPDLEATIPPVVETPKPPMETTPPPVVATPKPPMETTPPPAVDTPKTPVTETPTPMPPMETTPPPTVKTPETSEPTTPPTDTPTTPPVAETPPPAVELPPVADTPEPTDPPTASTPKDPTPTDPPVEAPETPVVTPDAPVTPVDEPVIPLEEVPVDDGDASTDEVPVMENGDADAMTAASVENSLADTGASPTGLIAALGALFAGAGALFLDRRRKGGSNF